MFMLKIKNLTDEDVFLPEFNSCVRSRSVFESAREDGEMENFKGLELLVNEGKIVMSSEPLSERVPCWNVKA